MSLASLNLEQRALLLRVRARPDLRFGSNNQFQLRRQLETMGLLRGGALTERGRQVVSEIERQADRMLAAISRAAEQQANA